MDLEAVPLLFSVYFPAFLVTSVIMCALHPSRQKYQRAVSLSFILLAALVCALASVSTALSSSSSQMMRRQDGSRFEVFSVVATIFVQLAFAAAGGSAAGILGTFQTMMMLNHLIPRQSTAGNALLKLLRQCATTIFRNFWGALRQQQEHFSVLNLAAAFLWNIPVITIVNLFVIFLTLCFAVCLYSFLFPRCMIVPRPQSTIFLPALGLLQDITLMSYYALMHAVSVYTLFSWLMLMNAVTLAALMVYEMLYQFQQTTRSATAAAVTDDSSSSRKKEK